MVNWFFLFSGENHKIRAKIFRTHT